MKRGNGFYNQGERCYNQGFGGTLWWSAGGARACKQKGSGVIIRGLVVVKGLQTKREWCYNQGFGGSQGPANKKGGGVIIRGFGGSQGPANKKGSGVIIRGFGGSQGPANKKALALLYSGFKTCFGWDPRHQTCWSRIR